MSSWIPLFSSLVAGLTLLPACSGPVPEAARPLWVEDEGGEQPFFSWSRPFYGVERLTARRSALARALRERGGGVFLAPSAEGFSSGQTFRQAEDFLYFTGLELPNSLLAIDSDADTSTLYVPERDARFESPARPNDFPGRALAADPTIREASGVAEVRPIEDLDEALSDWTRDLRPVWVDFGRAADEEPRTGAVRGLTPARSLLLHLRTEHFGLEPQNAFEPVARLRAVKSPEEIATIRRACAITVAGIRASAAIIRPGVDERTLEGEMEAAFKREGAQRLAFDSIIKSGPNSLWPWRILAAHYDRRNRAMRAGELVIYDVGCELDHYASDVGRTFPVSGRFSPEQRDLIRMATSVSDAILAAIEPGRTFAELQAIAEASIPSDERRYMQTGLFFGHHIGLSVGDPSLPEEPLEPGMIFTVEPWYYNHDRGVAVFLEDVVLVTEDGVENLTAELPRTPEELERMVRR